MRQTYQDQKFKTAADLSLLMQDWSVKTGIEIQTKNNDFDIKSTVATLQYYIFNVGQKQAADFITSKRSKSCSLTM